MNMRKYAFILIWLSALSLTAAAQSPSKILKQAEKALGGKALFNIRSMSKTGTIVRASDGAEGKYLWQTSAPNMLNVSYDLGGFEYETGYNGRSAWSRNSRDGLQTLSGKPSIDLQARALFRNELWHNIKNERSKAIFGGQIPIGGQNANVVLITTAKGVLIKLYFDAVTALPIRDEIPYGDHLEMTEYQDYRDVNGIKQPFSIGLWAGTEFFQIDLDEIRINPSIPRSEFDFPIPTNEPLPDIPSLLQQLQANEDNVEKMLDNYSFTQKTIDRELDKNGALRETDSETNQISFYKGYHITRLIEKNGKPLSEKDQVDADKDAAKQVAEIEKKIAKNESKAGKLDATGKPSDDGRRISIAEVLRASKLLNPRRERFRGRDVIVFDFEPDPKFDTKNATSLLKFFGKTAGVIWVDEKDKQVARIEAMLFESLSIGGGVLAKFNKGATFTLDKERVNDEIWLPSQADINFSLRVLLVKGIDMNQVQKFYDYKKFETEVKDAAVDGNAKP
jgi:hypothetical protein